MAKREKLSPEERREQSEACRGWVTKYGQDFRTARGCGRSLSSTSGHGGTKLGYGYSVAACARYLTDIVKRDRIEGVSVVASCVRRGFSHGVTQSSWRPKKK